MLRGYFRVLIFNGRISYRYQVAMHLRLNRISLRSAATHYVRQHAFSFAGVQDSEMKALKIQVDEPGYVHLWATVHGVSIGGEQIDLQYHPAVSVETMTVHSRQRSAGLPIFELVVQTTLSPCPPPPPAQLVLHGATA